MGHILKWVLQASNSPLFSVRNRLYSLHPAIIYRIRLGSVHTGLSSGRQSTSSAAAFGKTEILEGDPLFFLRRNFRLSHRCDQPFAGQRYGIIPQSGGCGYRAK